MKTVVKLMVVLVTSRPPITRGSTLSSARASKTNGSVDDRTTRRTARDGTGREAPGDPPPPPPPPGRRGVLRAEIKKAREEKHQPPLREASDRGPRPHVSCQARTRVSVRAPRG